MVPRDGTLKQQDESVVAENMKLRNTALAFGCLLFIPLLGVVLRFLGVEEWIQLTEAGASLLLSLALVIVYLRQNEILQEHRQMMSAGYSPVVSVQDVSFSERNGGEFPGGHRGQIQTVEVTAVNRGNDIAANLELRCILYQSERDTGGLLCKESSTLTDPRSVSLHLENESDGVYRDGGPALPPTMEDPTTLYGHVGVNVDGRYCSIPDAVDRVVKRGADSLRIGFVLRYDDVSGDSYSVLLRAFAVENPQQGMSFYDTVRSETELYRRDLDGRIDEELQPVE